MKAFLIPSALAASLGFTAGFAANNISEVNALPLSRVEVVCADVPAGQTVAIESAIANIICDDIKAEFGINTCPAAAIRERGVCLKWAEDGSIDMCSNIKQPGVWVAE